MAGAVQLFTADSAIAQQNPPCDVVTDFVTGGGFIVLDTNGAHGNFGVAGGCKNRSFWGHLEYVDHGSVLAPPSAPTPFNVHWMSITAYFPDSSDPTNKARFICGTARTNLPEPNDNVDFAVRAKDDHEPGVDDEFDIQLTQGTGTPPGIVYTTNFNFAGPPHKLNDGAGGGGNIQLHGPRADAGSCPARVGVIGAPA